LTHLAHLIPLTYFFFHATAPTEIYTLSLHDALPIYALPALETINGHRAVGHDVEFISLDMTNSCTIRCFRTPRRTVLLFGQWSEDRKSTRLNSSHVKISYAVFCLKKKNKNAKCHVHN